MDKYVYRDGAHAVLFNLGRIFLKALIVGVLFYWVSWFSTVMTVAGWIYLARFL